MFLKDLLFPKFCLGCGFLGVYICLRCQNKLVYLDKDLCLYCRKPSLLGFTHPGCRRKNCVDGFISIFYYNDFMKKIIKNIKYRLATDVWYELCHVIKPEKLTRLHAFKKLIKDDLCIEPIPLHAKKLRIRGFNQAKIIAQFFGSILNIPLTKLLIRKKDTLSQAQLENLKSRYENTLGAFQLKPEKAAEKKSFILIDDVLTTGSTIKEAARTIKKSGAKSVFVLTVAVG